ncbi:MAG: thioesterase family protein [Halobacteriales archaeon]|nr:thioesterase family protein [Halobacteriales archaeon]
MEGYRYAVDIDVRYRDLDPVGHVNNAVYATYLEHARTNYYADVLDLATEELSFVLAHVEIDYERSITAEDEVKVWIRVPRIGGKSMTTEFVVEASGEISATAESVQVVVDEEGTPSPVPEEWRKTITEFEGEKNVEDAKTQ